MNVSVMLPRDEMNRRFATAVTRLRMRLGLNQTEMGARYGVNQATVSRWERGKQIPEAPILHTIAREAGISVESLIGSSLLVKPPLQNISVVGRVESGVFQPAIIKQAELYTVSLPEQPEYAGLAREGYEVADQSANREYPKGSVLITVPFQGLGRNPMNGDHVIAFSHDHKKVEVTVNEYRIDASGNAWLVSLSIDAPMIPPVPAKEREIAALVVGSYRPRPAQPAAAM